MGHHHDLESGNKKVFWAILINFFLTFAQIVGGIFSGSLALIADAIHNLSDAIALVIAFIARKIAQRESNERMTFGYKRIEVVAALINYTTLIVLGCYLIYEAVFRFFNLQSIDGWVVVVIAVIALSIDLITALLTFSLSKKSINIRAAFLHNLADALGSIGVIISGIIILIYDWRLIDPIITLLIATYILWQSFSEIGGAIRILMLAAPQKCNVMDITKEITNEKLVEDVHHVHYWLMGEHDIAFDAHIVISQTHINEIEQIKSNIKHLLINKFDINHINLEIELSNSKCVASKKIGHKII